uniref:Chromosome 5 open reading frame 51 n=1 Tax=Calidris pygmaea TaxID=425635 RepID=A0A8C3J862_9CHAR
GPSAPAAPPRLRASARPHGSPRPPPRRGAGRRRWQRQRRGLPRRGARCPRCSRGWRRWAGAWVRPGERAVTAVLDITYFEENQLVDEDFPEESSLQKVKELICILSEPEDLVRECNINEEPINILGAELLECLYWRKGALLYMYCHTAKERSEWLRENIAIFKKCLNDGVHYLMKMLSLRCPLQLNEDVSFQDKDTARLLREGKKQLQNTHSALLLIVPLYEMRYYVFLLFDFICTQKLALFRTTTTKR